MPQYIRDTEDTPLGGIPYYIDRDNENIVHAAKSDARGRLITNDSTLTETLSALGEVSVTERTPIIELNSSYGFSQLRDVKTEIDGATLNTVPSSEFELDTGASANGAVILESAEIGRYIPGYSSEIGVGIRIPDSDNPSGNNVPIGSQEFLWGGMGPNKENGIFFGYDSGGYFVQLLDRNVVVQKTYRENWNVDSFDGNGPSLYNISNITAHIFRIEYTWYGYGEIKMGIIATDPTTQTQKPITGHIFRDFNGSSIASPNLRIYTHAKNNGTADRNLVLHVGGRQYSVIGRYVPKYRFVDDWRVGVATSTTPVPIVSFQRKTGFDDRSIKIQGLEAIVATEPTLIEVYFEPTLTGASYGTPTNYTAAETALDSDKSATSMSGGLLIYRTLINSGQANKSEIGGTDLDFDIPNGTVVTMAARTVTGTGSVTGLFRLKEEW